VIHPKYKYDERLKISREEIKPSSSLYMELGYDEDPPADPELSKKHYRRYFADELENKKKIFPKKPFHTADIIRGQSRGLGGGFFSFFKKPKTDESGMVSNLKVVGLFKGKVSIENKDEKDTFKALRDSRVKIIIALLKDLYER
jgi:hypothetical protein